MFWTQLLLRGTFRTPQWKKNEIRREAIFEGMMAMSSPKIMKDTKSQGAVQIHSRINIKKYRT